MSIDLCLVPPPRKCWLSAGILLGGLLAMVCSPAEAGAIVPTCLAGSLAALPGPADALSANGVADAPNCEQVAESETETNRDQPPRSTSDEPLPEAGQSDGQPGDPGSPAPPAHDSPPSPATPPVKPQAEGQVEDEKSTDTEPPDPEKMTDSEEDAELLERIKVGDGSPLDQAFEEFDQALEEMRSAEERLKANDTGDGTRKSQSQAAKRLEEILKLLQQPPPPSSSSSSDQQQQQQQKQQQQQQQQQQQGQGQRGARSRGKSSRSKSGAAAQRRQRLQGRQQRLAEARPRPAPVKPAPQGQQPGDSQEAQNPTGGEDRRGQSSPKTEEATKRRSDANDVWGHLPPTVREALQKSFNERYLPKYEELVRRYYESLAEKRRDSR